MWDMLLVTLMVICVGKHFVLTLKLLGPCPAAPNTHLPEINVQLYPETILGIGFSDENPSHVFKEITSKNSHGFEILLQKMEQSYIVNISYTDYNRPPISMLNCVGTVEKNNNSISLETEIFETVNESNDIVRKKCHKKIRENIRIWIEGDFIIIWSCINGSKSRDHDEAAIFLVNRPADNSTSFVDRFYLTYPDKVEEMIKRLKTAARKYLSLPLLEKIQWPKKLPIRGLVYNPFVCPAELSEKVIISVLIVILFVIAIGTVYGLKRIVNII